MKRLWKSGDIRQVRVDVPSGVSLAQSASDYLTINAALLADPAYSDEFEGHGYSGTVMLYELDDWATTAEIQASLMFERGRDTLLPSGPRVLAALAQHPDFPCDPIAQLEGRAMRVTVGLRLTKKVRKGVWSVPNVWVGHVGSDSDEVRHLGLLTVADETEWQPGTIFAVNAFRP